MTAKSERIADRYIDIPFLCFVWNIIQIAFRIRSLLIDCRVYYISLNRHNSSNRLLQHPPHPADDLP